MLPTLKAASLSKCQCWKKEVITNSRWLYMSWKQLLPLPVLFVGCVPPHLIFSFFRLNNVQKDLTTVVQTSGGPADRLVFIIQENGHVQDQIKGNLEAQVLQNVLTLILLRSDTDTNVCYSEKELKTLRLQLSNIPGVTLDKENFDRELVCGRRDMQHSDIMRMFRNLKERIPKEDNILHLQPAQLLQTNISLWY
jgi:hypothetical protein